MSFSTHYKRLARISLLVPCLLLIQPTQAKARSEVVEIIYYTVFSTLVSAAVINFCLYTGIYADPNNCSECKKPLDEIYDDSSLTKSETL